MSLTKGDKKWIEGVIHPVVEAVRENRELIVSVDGKVVALEEKVEELGSKLEKIDRKVTVVTDHQGSRLDDHEKRIVGLEVAV